ncbi:MAG: hypothetical protein LBO80_00785 [Treponema sp.]|jgi:hypothetical protein|nr:hypothetical protein [Treponema sp.]
MDISEILDELFHLEYPSLHADHDPDIERYYYLRSTGQSQDALALYQSRLKPRYPDDTFRTALMRSYRSRDPSFKGLLAKGYRALGIMSLERIKRTIEYISQKADSYNPRDVYSTIRAAEDILLALPRGRYEAAAGMERLFRYSGALNLRVKSMAQAADLVRAYLTDSLSVVEEEMRRLETMQRREKEEEQRRLAKADWQNYLWQKKHGALGRSMIDLSAVVFSPGDLARIEIPGHLKRIEDQVLAYCVKYWNLINDAAFERILFLYSRKYGSKNYDVFLAIRRGRLGKKRDDEILASVMSFLVTGYYYSIQGDRYLQRSWNAVRFSLQQNQSHVPALPAPAQAPLRLPPPKAGAGNKIAPVKKSKRARKIVPGKGAVEVIDVPVEKPAETKKKAKTPAGKAPAGTVKTKRAPPSGAEPAGSGAVKKAAPKAASKARAAKPEKAAPKARAAKPAVKPAVSPQAKPERAAPPKQQDIRAPKPLLPRRRKPGIVSAKTLDKPAGSVADRLRELSGRSYDVYQDRFLAKSRPAIRRVLGAGRGLFFTLPEEAEDLVYGFLREHYSDPYMDWEGSEEKASLERLGFELDSLNPVIDECFRNL